MASNETPHGIWRNALRGALCAGIATVVLCVLNAPVGVRSPPPAVVPTTPEINKTTAIAVEPMMATASTAEDTVTADDRDDDDDDDDAQLAAQIPELAALRQQN